MAPLLPVNNGVGEKRPSCSDFWSVVSSPVSFCEHLFIPDVSDFTILAFLFNSLGTWSKFPCITALIISSSPLLALLSFWNTCKLDGHLRLILWFVSFLSYSLSLCLILFPGRRVQLSYWNIHCHEELLQVFSYPLTINFFILFLSYSLLIILQDYKL